jgi:hypothetical protein
MTIAMSRLLLAATALAIALPAPAQARLATTPTFPTPASAKVQPTTTYVPAGATPLPSTSPTGAATTPTVPTRTLLKSTLHARAKRSGKLSTEAIVIAVIAALVALGCAAWGLARRRAFEPHWWLSLRHAMAEAGFRASATWAEFTDWARLGH